MDGQVHNFTDNTVPTNTRNTQNSVLDIVKYVTKMYDWTETDF